MAKSLSARIAERIARKKPAGNVRNRAAFLALRGEVKQAIDDGWPVKTIWETLHDEEKVAFSYQAFRGYVNRLILSPPANGETAPAPVVADQSGQAAPKVGPAVSQDAGRMETREAGRDRLHIQPNTEEGGSTLMAKIHMVLQGKGGVGKSFIATVIAQYKISKGQQPLCIDTDPVNATFHGFKALNVRLLEIMQGDEIQTRNFDTLVELIAPSTDDVIIDNGASSFVPLTHYLISNQVPALLQEMGHEMVVHTVITGSQALLDTVSGFAQLASQFPAEALFVVWLNPFWGSIEHDGKGFEQMKAYTANKARVSAIVKIPALKEDTYGRDLSDMLQERLTFDEALAMDSLTIMTRQRLKIVKGQLFSQLDSAAVL
jgi:hypothetical protein